VQLLGSCFSKRASPRGGERVSKVLLEKQYLFTCTPCTLTLVIKRFRQDARDGVSAPFATPSTPSGVFTKLCCGVILLGGAYTPKGRI
jgi:ribosomal protein L37AE/L43A